MNRRCDKMSRLEFVAIQFGVKFIAIYNLWHYVDGVCQRYLHFPYLFRKLCYFAKLFHDFILFYFTLFCFQGHIILFLIWIYGLGSPFYQWNHIYEI